MPLPPQRRRQLQELGLRALIKRRFGDHAVTTSRPVSYPGGAAIVTDDGLLAVFADSPAGLGAAVDLADRTTADRLYFFAEDNTTTVARRAAEFRVATTVVDPSGDFEPLEPAPPPRHHPRPRQLDDIAEWMAKAGLDVVWEHDVLTGEVRGLEVVRATDSDHVEVGVGKHDREANLIMHPEGATDEVLATAVGAVEDLRRAGAPVHPANQLAPERWLRAVAATDPAIIHITTDLQVGPTPERRDDLRERSVAPAWTVDADGRPVVFVFSVGIDPDLVAQAADARSQAPGWPGFPAADSPPRLVIVTPHGDDIALNRRVAGLLAHPAEMATVAPDWRGTA